MSERSALILVLIALGLGDRLAEDIGKGTFYAVLAVGWLVAIAWTFVAWRRGEPVLVWQKRNG